VSRPTPKDNSHGTQNRPAPHPSRHAHNGAGADSPGKRGDQVVAGSDRRAGGTVALVGDEQGREPLERMALLQSFRAVCNWRVRPQPSRSDRASVGSRLITAAGS
jgi:hypothetical protein